MIISSIYQGLLYGILGLGIYMTFRILDFPDLTTEGSFPFRGGSSSNPHEFWLEPYLGDLGCCNSRLSCWSSDWSPLYERRNSNDIGRNSGHDFP